MTSTPFYLKLLIALFLIVLPIIFLQIEKISAKKYKTTKNISEEIIKINEIENLVLAVLDSWNQAKLYQNSQFYSKNLLKKHDKHITRSEMYGKKESFFDIHVEGINNLHQYKHKITVEVSLKAKYSLSYDENGSLLYLVTSKSMPRFNQMLKQPLPEKQPLQKDVQKWELIIEEGHLKVNKFSLNLK